MTTRQAAHAQIDMWLFDVRWDMDSEFDDYNKQLLDEKMERFLVVKDQYNVDYNYEIMQEIITYEMKCQVTARFYNQEDAMLFKLKYQDLLNELR